jgi:hypothetical protein
VIGSQRELLGVQRPDGEEIDLDPAGQAAASRIRHEGADIHVLGSDTAPSASAIA